MDYAVNEQGFHPLHHEQQSDPARGWIIKLQNTQEQSKANNPLATVDADDRPHGVLPPHGSAGQLSKRVVASAPQLRRQVDDVDPQEHEES